MGATAESGRQPLRALERANEIRIERSRLLGGNPRRGGRSGLLSRERAAELLLDPPVALGGATVSQLLLRVRWVGAMKTEKLCRLIGASESRRIGDLTERQRRVLAELLRGES